MLFIFSMPVLIRHLWQLKSDVFLHWCIKCSILFGLNVVDTFKPISLKLH